MIRSKIRKITIGENPMNAMAFQVGKLMNDGYVISDIVEDTNNIHIYGCVRYLVFTEKDKKSSLWKSFERLPISIEYDKYSEEKSLL